MLASSKRRVKIVCTLGPSTQDAVALNALMKAGMSVVRLNFSHSDSAHHGKMIEIVRSEAKKLGLHVPILQDLQGPKIRVGILPAQGLPLKPGDQLLIHPEGQVPQNSKKATYLIPMSAETAGPISKVVKKGAKVLFDDGRIIAQVVSVSPPEMVVELESGGVLKSRKGMNFPKTPLAIPCVTEKDLQDLKFGLSKGVDAVALSFVRSPEDIEAVREMIQKNSNERPMVIAKIEREEAVDLYEAIIEVSDGLLVARGDMAVEVGVERVPIIQKELIRGCHALGVPVITATQMLESMIDEPTPTRAEASDVANAVFDGTDAVMLSAETASGQYPIEAVKTMAKIVEAAEESLLKYSRLPALEPLDGSVVDSIEYSAAQVAQHVGAVAIVCLTHSGMAARTLAKYRPQTPIIAIMEVEKSLRKMAFAWGVHGIVIDQALSTDNMFPMIEKILIENRIAENGDMIVITAGIPTMRRGTTNMVKVHQIGKNIERQIPKF